MRPGTDASRVIARGSIRVDARRAVAKLREHLLVDLHSYALEIARAAVAVGASRMRVRWDSDDMVFAFDGRPFEPERLVRLLDYALADSGDPATQALRTLALGVNAALGLGPAWVAVVSTSPGSPPRRVRWSPDALAAAEANDAAMPELEIESVSRDQDAFEAGTLVHVRRRLGLRAIKRAALGQPPRELTLLAEATHETPLEITAGGQPLPRSARPKALIRVPLELPGAASANVELLPAGSPSTIELLERGVRLLAGIWTPLPGAPALSKDGSLAIPARVVVDTDELPTNASRSALREDSSLATRLAPAAADAFRVALAALIAKVTGAPPPDATFAQVESDPGELEECLGAIACVAAAGAPEQRPAELARVLEVPLLHTATGGRVPLSALPRSGGVYAWRDKQLPEQLAPWVSHVLWLRGRTAERALFGLTPVDASPLVKEAQAGAKRRERLLQHAPSAPSVPRSPRELCRRAFRLDSGHTAGLFGEVALLAPDDAEGAATFRVFVEDRLLETITLDRATCPLALEAAFTWPGRVRARFGYDAVERDGHLAAALYAVGWVAVGLAGEIAHGAAGKPAPERELANTVLRDALASLVVLPERLGFVPPLAEGLARGHAALWSMQIFSTTDPERRVSLRELGAYARNTGALCLARGWQPTAVIPAVDRRPVLVASQEQARWLSQLFGDSVQTVWYDRGVARDQAWRRDDAARRDALRAALDEERVRQQMEPGGPALWFEVNGALAVMAPAHSARTIELHCCQRLAARPRASGSNIVAIDDPRSVPNDEWSDLVYAPGRAFGPQSQELAKLLLCAMEGDATARTTLGEGWDPANPDPTVRSYLLVWSGELARRANSRKDPRERETALALAQRVDALPLLDVLDAEGCPQRLSIAQVRSLHPVQVPVLDQVPGFATLDWAPVVATHVNERTALLHVFAKTELATAELPARQARAEDHAKYRALLARPTTPLAALGGRMFVGDIMAVLEAGPSGEPAAAAALPSPAIGAAGERVALLFQGRAFGALGVSDVPLPLVGNVDLGSAEQLEGWAQLSASGTLAVRSRLLDAGQQLARALIEAAKGPAGAGRLLGDPRAVALFVELLRCRPDSAPRELTHHPDLAWPTIQGGAAPFADLARVDRAVWIGRTRFGVWHRAPGRAPSELDRPILWLPPGAHGDGVARLLDALGFSIGDVSDACAKLQAQRGGGASPPPRLGGTPVHPLLRADLGELGFGAGDGEIELVEQAAQEITVILLGGAQVRLPDAESTPVRAVIRVDAIAVDAIAGRLREELATAARDLLARTVPALAQMPPFVRDHLRARICELAAASTSLDPGLAAAPVFEDTAGEWWSLGQLVLWSDRVRFTTLEPPFPTFGQPMLRLSQVQAAKLEGAVKLVQSDMYLARERDAQRRRQAPALGAILLAPDARAKSALTTTVRHQGVIGELGVLFAAGAELRGVHLYVNRRPLCTLPDGEGWPIIAALNDDRIEPNRWFDAPERSEQGQALTELARSLARGALQHSFQPPSDALASRWLEDQQLGDFRATGRLWLPGVWPAEPKVRIHAQTPGAPQSRAFFVTTPLAGLSGVIPVAGDLLLMRSPASAKDAASAEGTSPAQNPADQTKSAWAELSRHVAQLAAELLAEASQRSPASPELEAYAFNLALLGFAPAPPPFQAADGSQVSLERFLKELRRAGRIWLSDRAGWSEGDFPGTMPDFVLSDDGSAPVRVLEHRAPVAVRRLGGIGAAPVIGLVRSEPVAPPAMDGPDEREAPGAGWLSSLGERLTSLVASPEPEPAQDGPLAALGKLIAELGLVGNPVTAVVEARRGKPVAYDKSGRRLRVNVTDAAVARVIALAQEDPRALAVLAAAAVSEINRALVEVTDFEEKRALVALLRDA